MIFFNSHTCFNPEALLESVRMLVLLVVALVQVTLGSIVRTGWCPEYVRGSLQPFPLASDKVKSLF